ncbi:hypothetical protein ACFLYH_02910 [Candidatus Dependentiae bacterium]
MMLENINFEPGKITYNDFSPEIVSFLIEEDVISEKDLLQVVYPKNFLLDVGWNSGVFIISVIKKCDWEHPILEEQCKSLNDLEKGIREFIEVIKQKIKEENINNANKMLMYKDIDFSPGEILYLDFYVDPSLTIEENSTNWDKELVHIDYPNNLIFQIEWKKDYFIIELIKNRRWEKPLFKKTCKSLDELDKIVKECTKMAKDLSVDK